MPCTSTCWPSWFAGSADGRCVWAWSADLQGGCERGTRSWPPAGACTPTGAGQAPAVCAGRCTACCVHGHGRQELAVSLPDLQAGQPCPHVATACCNEGRGAETAGRTGRDPTVGTHTRPINPSPPHKVGGGPALQAEHARATGSGPDMHQAPFEPLVAPCSPVRCDHRGSPRRHDTWTGCGAPSHSSWQGCACGRIMHGGATACKDRVGAGIEREQAARASPGQAS